MLQSVLSVGRQRCGLPSVSTVRVVAMGGAPALQQRFEQRCASTAACGILGLPNVGKSTLFNALTRSQAAEASNFPFCTIEPNTALVSVPDERQKTLCKMANSKRVVPGQIELVDIAGLVKGASQGQGLGNKFLQNIRDTSVLVHVIRCFEDVDVHHVGEVDQLDPISDLETIETELVLADLATVEKRLGTMSKKKTATQAADVKVLEAVLEWMNEGRWVRVMLEQKPDEFDEAARTLIHDLHLLTTKPVLYLCNVDEDGVMSGGNDLSKAVVEHVKANSLSPYEPVIVCSKLEEEIATLVEAGDDEGYQNMLSEFGLEQSGLSKVVLSCYQLLGLQTFFTVGPEECRAWSINKGDNAQTAAGKIHSDIAQYFITAETAAYDDYIEFRGSAGCKAQGKLRAEGREYVCKDGDIFNFKFNVTKSK